MDFPYNRKNCNKGSTTEEFYVKLNSLKHIEVHILNDRIQKKKFINIIFCLKQKFCNKTHCRYNNDD